MAGIGWKLQRMIDHGSLAGTIAAYLTGVAVTSAPWLLTTAVLTSLRLVSRHATGDFEFVERFLTVVYAVTVVVSAPVHVVVSRYTADRLYDRHTNRIAPPLRRAAALTLAGFALIGVALVLLLRLPLALALVGAPLTAVIGAQWLMLSVGGGMMSPVVLLRAFCVGAPLSLVAALAVSAPRPPAAPATCSGSRPANWSRWRCWCAGSRARCRPAPTRARGCGLRSSSTSCSRCPPSRTTSRSGRTRSSST